MDRKFWNDITYVSFSSAYHNFWLTLPPFACVDYTRLVCDMAQ